MYNQSIRVGNSLFALCNEGLIDVGQVVLSNSVLQAKAISLPILNAKLNYKEVKLVHYGSHLGLTVNNEGLDYWFNMETEGWYKINGQIIGSGVGYSGEFYFIDNKGVFYSGYNADSDEEWNGEEVVKKEIRGLYITSWSDLGSSNNKRADFVVLDCFMEGGDYAVWSDVISDYNVDIYNKATLPKQFNLEGVGWEDLEVLWEEGWNKLQWGGEKANAYNKIKFTRGSMGRSLAIKYEIAGLDVKDFIIGKTTIIFTIANK